MTTTRPFSGTTRQTTPSQDPVPFGVPGTWTLDFYDDFDGPANSAPNLTRWNYWNVDTDRGTSVGLAPFWMRRENSYLSGNGELVLRSTTADIGYGSEQSCGGLETAYYMGPEEFLEFEAQVDGVIWFAGWSQSATGMFEEPFLGVEYDILETYTVTQMQQNLHRGGYGGGHQAIGHNITSATLGDWVKVGFWRSVSGGFARFYINGALDYQTTDPNYISALTDHGMRLTCETNGSTPLAFAKVRYAARWTGSGT